MTSVPILTGKELHEMTVRGYKAFPINMEREKENERRYTEWYNSILLNLQKKLRQVASGCPFAYTWEEPLKILNATLINNDPSHPIFALDMPSYNKMFINEHLRSLGVIKGNADNPEQCMTGHMKQTCRIANEIYVVLIAECNENNSALWSLMISW